MRRIKFTPAFELTYIAPPKKMHAIHSVHKSTEKRAIPSLFSQRKQKLDKTSQAPLSKKHQEAEAKTG